MFILKEFHLNISGVWETLLTFAMLQYQYCHRYVNHRNLGVIATLSRRHSAKVLNTAFDISIVA